MLSVAWWAALGTPVAGAETNYGPAEKLAELENKDIYESSGLAASRRHPGIYWTHNDSGDQPRLFAFDEAGRHQGTSAWKGAKAVDWEDMGSFTYANRPYLFVADVGDNARQRNDYTLYIAVEPDSPRDDVQPRALAFRYEDGSRDCEAVGFDPTTKTFLLVEKQLLFSSRVYQLPLKPNGSDKGNVAREIGRIRAPMATGLDVSPDGGRLIVATYGPAYEFSRQPDEDWSAAFKRSSRLIALPARRQGEAICYGSDGISLLVTSEKRPCPLWVLRPKPTEGTP